MFLNYKQLINNDLYKDVALLVYAFDTVSVRF